ncbi:MAG: sugar phosphate isomerase/epimerase [Planctomycetes bacterium]|nr:sugar phosphate isomerase/epimerase [Planctomycetota bacterium]
MTKCGNWPVGVCSWSLQTDIAGVAAAMDKIGLESVHLAVGPAVGDDRARYVEAVRKQSWIVSCTMIDFPQEDYSTLETIRRTGGIAPDDCWEANRRRFLEAADVTAELGVGYISTHIGFIDHTREEYTRKFYDRTKCLADAAAEKGLSLLLETGQESAVEMRQFMQKLNHPAIGINFDPANIILYNKGEPLEAIHILASWIKHVHIKDAVRTKEPGTWGLEVPWGIGEVGVEQFLRTLRKVGYKGTLAIEREAGDDRFGDIAHAAKVLAGFGKM